MKNLTIKTIGIFTGFLAIWNFAWMVALFSLMNNMPGHLTDDLPAALLIWFIGAVIGAVLIGLTANEIEKKYNNRANLSDTELQFASKKSLNIHITSMLIYGVIWLLMTFIMYFILRANYGNIAALSIWVGGLAGLLACPFMVFSVMPILFSKANRDFSEELKKRKLKVKGFYVSIRNKLSFVFGASIVGLVIWIGGFAYYTGINQMIEEVKVSRQDYQQLIINTILKNNKDDSKETLIQKVNEIKPAANELILLSDNQGNLLAPLTNKTFETKQPVENSIKELFNINNRVSYDNINQNVLVSHPLTKDTSLITIVNIAENTSRMGIFFLWFIVFMLIGFFVALVNALSLSAWLGKTIKNLLELFKKLTNNDFSENATKDSADELGNIADRYNIFIVSIRKLIGSIQTASQAIFQASNEISANNQSLTQRTSEQASSVEELSSVLEQISSTIGQNTDNSKQTEEIAQKSVKGISLTNKSVADTIEAMKDITQKALLIIEIARQTDILAINAAIEAARAGQMGRGFAVVASEVRKLAENTKEASNQIEQLTNSGIVIADRSGKLLADTVEQMTKTSELVRQVAEASIDQNSGIEQITTSTNELNKIAQENASTAEETAASSEELTSQANELFDLVSKFKI